ncbi:hypothetical protein GE115_10755 [Agromyces sp. CFH 90414]|uniref:Uncharacterized protein n=1 Tax=Agromyces agglutinans TaxID=2662258 RepID=A0A6I2F6I9_9MICO|nr:hypothetical protein [Agromyces agglutinans]MRG60342.1 hypothetical protein [Agromyces agglutinans]
MKVLTNGTGSFVTGTEIADAVMNYAMVLQRQQAVDLVSIPVVVANGEVEHADLLVGWQTGTAAVTTAERGDGELVEIDTIVGLYERASRSGVARAVPFTEEELAEGGWSMLDEYGQEPLGP